MMILPLAKVIAERHDDGVYEVWLKERSVHEWLCDYLPEGTKFVVTSVEVDGEEMDVKVTARYPAAAQIVNIQLKDVPLDSEGIS